MLGKLVVCSEGLRFVAGLPYARLAERARKADQKAGVEHVPSFIELSNHLVKLSPDELFQMDGFAVVLKPGQAARIPEGSLVCEAAVSPICIVSHWNVIRPPSHFKEWTEHVRMCMEGLEADMKNGGHAQGSSDDGAAIAWRTQKGFLVRLLDEMKLSLRIQGRQTAAAAAQVTAAPAALVGATQDADATVPVPGTAAAAAVGETQDADATVPVPGTSSSASVVPGVQEPEQSQNASTNLKAKAEPDPVDPPAKPRPDGSDSPISVASSPGPGQNLQELRRVILPDTDTDAKCAKPVETAQQLPATSEAPPQFSHDSTHPAEPPHVEHGIGTLALEPPLPPCRDEALLTWPCEVLAPCTCVVLQSRVLQASLALAQMAKSMVEKYSDRSPSPREQQQECKPCVCSQWCW